MFALRTTRSRVLEVRLSADSRGTLGRIAAHYGVDGLSPATVVELLIQEKADELGISTWPDTMPLHPTIEA